MTTPVVAPVTRERGILRQIDASGIPSLLARLALGGTFLYMGFDKTKDPGGFLKQIHEYHMLPDGSFMVMNLMAAVLPWVEVFCGLLLILGIAIRGTALPLLVMLVGFTGAVAYRAHGIYTLEKMPFCAIKFDCGCGGGEVYICRKLAENTCLILLSVFLLWSSPIFSRLALAAALLGSRKPPTAT